MSDLPQGWQECALENISSDISYGYTAKSSATIGDARMLRITDIQDNKVDWAQVPFCKISESDKGKYLLRKWDLVFARTGATVGKSFLIRDDAPNSVFASYLIRVRSIEKDMARYLSHYFDSHAYWGQITEFSAGVGQPNVNGSKLKSLRVPLAPLPEQKRIVDKLDIVLARVDACRERLNRVSLILKRFRQSVLVAAMSGKLTADWREEYARALIAGESDLSDTGREQSFLPYGWISETLAKVTKLDLGYAFKSADFIKNGVRLLRGDNIEPRKLRWNEPAFYDPSRLGEYQHLFLNAGDIVLAMDRPIITSGLKIARVQASDMPCVLVQRVCRFVPTDRISADYLYQALCNNAFVNYLQDAQNGTQIPHISGKQILSFEIPIPPVAEQEEIVRRVETLFAFADRLEGRIATAREIVNRLTPALLAKAFRGELVPQDPNDEPAAELLKRLTTKRSEIGVKQSRGRAAKANEHRATA